jgi:hypothetical protein
VVEAGVEDGALRWRTAGDLDLVEEPRPFALSEIVDTVDVPGWDFVIQVGAGVGDADEGEADFHQDFALGAEVEPGTGVAGVLFSGGGVHGVVMPHGGADERVAEFSGEVEGVTGGRAAEAAGAGFAFDGVAANEAYGCAVLCAGGVVGLLVDDGGVGAAASVEQEARGRSSREIEAGDAGGVGDGDLDAYAVGERDSVVAGVGGFLGVIEGLGIEVAVDMRADGEIAGPGKDGDVSVERAAGAGEVGEGEAGDAVGVVAVPGVGAGVGAPLDHAPGESCAREGVAAAGGSDEGVDGVVGGGRRRLSEERETEEQNKRWSK